MKQIWWHNLLGSLFAMRLVAGRKGERVDCSSTAPVRHLCLHPQLALVLITALIVFATPLAQADFWKIDPLGEAVSIVPHKNAKDCTIEMHGQRAIMHVELPGASNADLKIDTGWPILRDPADLRGGIVNIPGAMPLITTNGSPLHPSRRSSYNYDGVLSINHDLNHGIKLERRIFPSVDLRACVDQWIIENQIAPVTWIEAPTTNEIIRSCTNALGEPCLLERTVLGFGRAEMLPGHTFKCTVIYTLRRTSEPQSTVNPSKELAARRALFQRARQALKLETPEPDLNGTFDLAKMRLLEAPVESSKGLLQGTGTRAYMGGVWANDNVEYAAPICPFFNDPALTDSCNNMFSLWLTNSLAHISPSFESYRLQPIGYDRGDQAMMLYGLSSYLMALDDPKLAGQMWPLIEKSIRLIKSNTTTNGIVASRTDELEGRYPTGTANLSTSSLSYRGYVAAARLAAAMNQPAVASDCRESAAALSKSIESYFGKNVEGFDTYRYFDGCTVLRGWICLPVAFGITNRAEATFAALFSPKLWCENGSDIGIKTASTDKGGAWPRETYYTLRAAFSYGDAQVALEKTLAAARSAMLGSDGPYMDEETGDLLAPNVLYLRVITDGLFGLEMTGFDKFVCKPQLPPKWNSMKLSNLHIAGEDVNLAVERDGKEIKLTITHSGTAISKTGAPGTPFEVSIPKN